MNNEKRTTWLANVCTVVFGFASFCAVVDLSLNAVDVADDANHLIGGYAGCWMILVGISYSILVAGIFMALIAIAHTEATAKKKDFEFAFICVLPSFCGALFLIARAWCAGLLLGPCIGLFIAAIIMFYKCRPERPTTKPASRHRYIF